MLNLVMILVVINVSSFCFVVFLHCSVCFLREYQSTLICSVDFVLFSLCNFTLTRFRMGYTDCAPASWLQVALFHLSFPLGCSITRFLLVDFPVSFGIAVLGEVLHLLLSM